MRAQPTTQFKIDTKRKWEAAAAKGREAQKKVITDACDEFIPPYSYEQMTRQLNLRARKRSHSPQEQARLNDVAEYAEKVWAFKMLADYDLNTFSIKQAYKALVRNGEIPESITLKAIYAAIERLHLRNISASPAGKFRGGESPYDLFEADYSKSEYFHFNAKDQIYIEKPIYTKKNESRLMIAAAVDYSSRVCWFRYYLVEGENAVFVRDAILAAFEEKYRMDIATGEISYGQHILQGIPKIVYWDRGSGNAAADTREGLLRLGVKDIKGANQKDSLGRPTKKSNKKGRGVIEKAIGDFKQCFEADLWGRHLQGELPPDMTLRDLNELVDKYSEEVNNAKHPVLSDYTRWELFENAAKSAKFPPDEARMFFTAKIEVTVIGRLVYTKKGTAFVAPDWADDHEKIEIIPTGKECYTFHNGEMIKLKPQAGSMREMIEEEKGQEVYEGNSLRERFADELDIASSGAISGIKQVPEDLKDDVKEFFSKPRSVEEIKLKAAYFAMMNHNLAKGKVIEFKEVLQ